MCFGSINKFYGAVAEDRMNLLNQYSDERRKYYFGHFEEKEQKYLFKQWLFLATNFSQTILKIFVDQANPIDLSVL